MRGGKREGSGRKVGVSKVTLLKRKIQDYFAEEEVQALIEDAKIMARKKPEIMKFLLEQLFGKAPQRIEMTGKDGNLLKIVWLSDEESEEAINESANNQNPIQTA